MCSKQSLVKRVFLKPDEYVLFLHNRKGLNGMNIDDQIYKFHNQVHMVEHNSLHYNKCGIGVIIPHP